MSNKQELEEYVPYGPEWEKEMSKFPKPALIKLLSKALQEKKEAPATGQGMGEVPLSEITLAMREADEAFELAGGGTRHYLRDCFLPILKKKGMAIVYQSTPQGSGQGMKWVKASERMPDKEGRYCVKRLSELMIADATMFKNGVMAFTTPNGMMWKGWKDFEWLDQSPQPDKEKAEATCSLKYDHHFLAGTGIDECPECGKRFKPSDEEITDEHILIQLSKTEFEKGDDSFVSGCQHGFIKGYKAAMIEMYKSR